MRLRAKIETFWRVDPLTYIKMAEAIEALADHLHPQWHEAIKRTKDVAAAAVLVTSLGALGVGAAFTMDQVWPLLQRWLA